MYAPCNKRTKLDKGSERKKERLTIRSSSYNESIVVNECMTLFVEVEKMCKPARCGSCECVKDEFVPREFVQIPYSSSTKAKLRLICGEGGDASRRRIRTHQDDKMYKNLLSQRGGTCTIIPVAAKS